LVRVTRDGAAGRRSQNFFARHVDRRNFFVDIKLALGNNPALFRWMMPS
jgi:hypothetical protein